MAPSADMFELGVKVQVLRKGSLYAQRAGKLYDLYSRCQSIEEIPPTIRESIEREIFGCGLAEVEALVRDYFSKRKPARNCAGPRPMSITGWL